MQETWFSRELPVLEAAVSLCEDNLEATVADIAAATGINPDEVARSLLAMDGTFVDFQTMMGEPEPWYVRRIYPAARQAVGQWPTPESFIDGLAQAFGAAADRETDPKRRSRLREVASVLGETGRDLAVEVAARVILRQTGMG